MTNFLQYDESKAGLVAARESAVGDGHSALLALSDDGALAGLIEWCDQAFESEQLGIPVARIARLAAWDESAAKTTLDDLLEQCLAKLRDSGAALVSCRLPESRVNESRALEQAGFFVVECLVTLARPIPANPPAGTTAGLMREGEEESCAVLAGTVFTHDRFHSDPAIDDAGADRLKAQWVRNSCYGRADAVIVAREVDRIVGFNACMKRGGTAIIDLIGVAADAQGKGHGRALIEGALAHYAGKADEMVVGTQSRNYGSLALYQSCEFRVRESAFTFHVHF